MENYLVTYEYKKQDGCLVHTKTETKVLNMDELRELTERNTFYDNYIKIIYCQKL